MGFRPFILVIIWTFSESKSQKRFEKSNIHDFSAFWPLLLMKAWCSDPWYRKNSYKILHLFHPVTQFYLYYFWSNLKNKFVTFKGITRYDIISLSDICLSVFARSSSTYVKTYSGSSFGIEDLCSLQRKTQGLI